MTFRLRTLSSLAVLLLLPACSALDKNVWPLFAGSPDSTTSASTTTANTGSLSSSAPASAAPIVLRPPGGNGPAAPGQGISVANGIAERRPLVVIRFDRPDPSFDQPLYDAVSLALQRKPDALFDLVAMAPPPASLDRLRANEAAAQRNMQTVLRSLTTMGLPAERVTLSATTTPATTSDEIRVYVR